MSNDYIMDPVPVEEEDSKLQQCRDFLVTLSDEAWKGFLDMMKVARSTEKKMKEVEKQLDVDSEKELEELVEETEKKLSKKK